MVDCSYVSKTIFIISLKINRLIKSAQTRSIKNGNFERFMAIGITDKQEGIAGVVM